MSKIIVSIDYDGTFTEHNVQQYARSLLNLGVEIYIVTARLDEKHSPGENWNTDLFTITESFNIPFDNIVFCNYRSKCDALNSINPVFHLDDDMGELSDISINSDIPGILYNKKNKWVKWCDIAI